MSNPIKQCAVEEYKLLDSCSAVEFVLAPKDKDLGGFQVRRALPSRERRMVGPWVFFDHMGPAEFAPGPGIDVRPHPHIGIATVTYLFEGEILHRDSVGSYQAIRPGDINLMVAGSGIVHSERERPEMVKQQRRLDGLQLWMALPEQHEETDPAFYHYSGADIPQTVVDGVPVRVMMGSAYEVTSPVKLFCETLYLEADLKKGQSLTLPQVAERALYTVQGAVKISHTLVPEHSMAFIKAGELVSIVAEEDSRIALIGGEASSPRHMEWNFVSSDKARIEQAKIDWKEGRFDKVVGDEDEFIPLPE